MENKFLEYFTKLVDILGVSDSTKAVLLSILVLGIIGKYIGYVEQCDITRILSPNKNSLLMRETVHCSGHIANAAYSSSAAEPAFSVPCESAFRYALINASRSPSITACTLPVSQPVRTSLTSVYGINT